MTLARIKFCGMLKKPRTVHKEKEIVPGVVVYL